jgi:hypothetical protein
MITTGNWKVRPANNLAATRDMILLDIPRRFLYLRQEDTIFSDEGIVKRFSHVLLIIVILVMNAFAFRNLAVFVDQDDFLLSLRQAFLASGGKLPDASARSPSVQAILVQQPISDVDELPTVKPKPNKNAYGIVIGIEHYRQKLPKADFATHDARTVTEYLSKVMGFAEDNVVTLLNDKATKSDFDKYIGKWLSNNVDHDSSVFIPLLRRRGIL